MALSKPKLLQTLIPLLSFIATLFLMLATKVHSQDTTSFTFNSFDSNSNVLTYQGDAFVPSGSKFLRLTKTDASGNPAKYSAGRVLYSRPVQFWELQREASFETTITFVITPVDNNPADGLAFFIAPVNSTIPPGSTGGTFGIFNSSSGTASSVFAVEFDTYVNSAWDPSYRHIGIDIESRTSRNVTSFENSLGQVVTARINYVSNTRTISVNATYGSQISLLSYVFDLKTILPQQVQVGISAGTGGQIALHDLYSWYFTSTLVWDGNNVEDKGNNDGMYIRQYVM